MAPIEKLAWALKARPRAIIFGSFLHGSGRSTLADLLARSLEARGLEVSRISSGQIFRELAEKEGKTIEEFIQEITENPEKAREVDVAVDREIARRIEESLKDGKIAIVDSNVAPFYASGLKVLVKIDPRIAGERVYKGRRKGDKGFSSPEEARASLEKRTRNDVERYNELARDPGVPEEWRLVYKRTVEGWGDESQFDLVVDNSGPLEKSFERLVEGLAGLVD